MSSRSEPTSQQARSLPLLGFREVSAPHAGLFSPQALAGSDQMGLIRSDLVLAAVLVVLAAAVLTAAATVAATTGREGCG
jgi:hypothetical protein